MTLLAGAWICCGGETGEVAALEYREAPVQGSPPTDTGGGEVVVGVVTGGGPAARYREAPDGRR